jgi:hypothetical protein
MRTMEELRNMMYNTIDTNINKNRMKYYETYEYEYNKPWYDKIPERFRNVFKNGNVEDKLICSAAKDYVRDKAWRKGAWLFIGGSGSGIGKSFDCAWVVSKYIEDTKKGFIWEMPEKITSDMISSDYMTIAYEKQTMLVIDDMDKFASSEGDNAYKKNIMHHLIEARMDIKLLPTLINCNADVERLEKIYTVPLIRRVLDASEGYRSVK